VRPSPDGWARAVELRVLRVQLVERGELVFQLDSAALAAAGSRKLGASTAAAAIIEREDGEAFFGQNLMEQRISSAPCFLHHLCGGAPVDVHNQRQLLARVG